MTTSELWITYAWADNAEGDFSFLVQELDTAGITARYDRIALVPGGRLWEQIAARITSDPLSGWAYLVTPRSLESEPCREELAYALDRALSTKGRNFPLIGLLHGGVRIEDVPPALRTRLCVSLASPNWKEEVRAALEGHAPNIQPKPQTRFVWTLHRRYGGRPNASAIEVRPRFGEVTYWRFLVPKTARILGWGWGPAGGGEIAGGKFYSIDGAEANLESEAVTYFGSADKLSPNVSAYVQLQEPLPRFVAFGLVKEQFGPPTDGETFWLPKP